MRATARRDSGKESKCKVVGRLTSMPESGLLGIWGIDTVSYTVDMNSDHTPAMACCGQCLCESRIYAEWRDLVIKTMHTTHAFRCDGVWMTMAAGGEMFGIIGFPLSSTGVLTVNGSWWQDLRRR